MVFGFFRKKGSDREEEVDIEPVSFLGTLDGQQVNLKPHARLVDAGLSRAKDLVTDALSRRADTIRVEPRGGAVAVTFLIDGMPYPAGKIGKTEGLAITQMLKLLAGLDVRQRKSPQSGGIRAEFDSKPYQLGVHSIPVAEGERLLVRVTDQTLKLDTPQEVGMSDEMRQKLRDICAAPGVLVVVGPPGSGTTTTLYAVLRNVDAFIFTIYTIGDTGGRKLHHVTAFDVNPEDDLATTITRAVRKEANVILCDPIRDAATAQTIFSKHEDVLLLTEFTAKDTSSAVLQLAKWVGDPELVAAGLKGVVTQKLIRLLCTECRVAYKPKPEFLRKIGLPDDLTVLYRKPPDAAEGTQEAPCEACGGVGYFGRTGMFELLEMTDGMRSVVTSNLDPAAIRTQMKKEKMTTLQSDGLRLVAEGKTSLEELQRVFKAGN